jgi:hypothetical protein
MSTELVGDVIRQSIVLRGSETLSGFVRDGSKKLAQVGSSTPTFTVGATAVIAVTSFACGGLAGWALKELLGGK